MTETTSNNTGMYVHVCVYVLYMYMCVCVCERETEGAPFLRVHPKAPPAIPATV